MSIEDCPAVERNPNKLSGALVFRGTRMPVSAIFSNIQAGLTLDDAIALFPGTTRAEVDAVFDHLIWEMQAPAMREREPLYPKGTS